MLCCPTVIGGLILLIVSLVFLSKRKKSQKLQSHIDALKDKANAWNETDITDFDPLGEFDESDFEDMKDRLKKRIVVPNYSEPDKNPYGTPAPFVNLVAGHLVESFDFSMVSDVLGRFKHYKTVIGDINLHFIHMVGSEEKKCTPILLLHGWPSTVWEFHKSIPILLEQGYTFVAPSLPGHGFTEAPIVSGVSPAVIACAYHKLMVKLGYQRYVINGGDWGSMIGCMMTSIYPENVIGLHNTLNVAGLGWRPILQLFVGAVAPALVYTTEQERKTVHPISEISERMYRGMAYVHAQSVMPDTYGYGMLDSPVGLIGWIGFTMANASCSRDSSKTQMENLQEGIKNYGLDNLCANLAIFWATRSAQASMRIYYEFHANDRDLHENLWIPDVPVAISNFPNEIAHITKFASATTYGNIKQYTYHEHGGHFAHEDNPDGVIGDLISFIKIIT